MASCCLSGVAAVPLLVYVRVCSVGVRGLLATASEDGSVRLYDVEEAARPACVGSKDMNIGKLFTVSFFSHSPWLLAAGGETDKLAIWETDVVSARNDDSWCGLVCCWCSMGLVAPHCFRLCPCALP